MKFNELASEEVVNATIENLKANGIEAEIVPNGQAAFARVMEILPAGSEVFNMTSTTLDTIGLSKEITESGKFNAVRPKLMDESVSADEKRRIGAAPEWAVGSVHAVTEDGHVLIASNSGSQLPAYAYGAAHVVWVVGTQKIVKDFETALKRIYEHTLPLEGERANKAYNITSGSAVNKLLVINKENDAARSRVIFVNEVLGF
jgi:hypothetical protein